MDAPKDDPLWLRLAWFVGLWAASVSTVAALAYVMRLWLT